MKFIPKFWILILAISALAITSCDVTSSQIQTEEDQVLLIRFQNLTNATLEDVSIDELPIGELTSNEKTEYIEFERLYLDAVQRPDLNVSSSIGGAIYKNVIASTHSNGSMSGNCTTGCSATSSHYAPNGTSRKKIVEGYYTVTISANLSNMSEAGDRDLTLILGLSED